MIAKSSFQQRAARLRAQLADVRADLAEATPDQITRLRALEASLKRSLRWYTARAGTRNDVNALQVRVAEEIRTSTS